jgi:hypothetical protein
MIKTQIQLEDWQYSSLKRAGLTRDEFCRMWSAKV